MNILLTGGAGYIGSHTAVSLVLAGHHIHILDNLSNSRDEVIEAIQTIVQQPIAWTRGDIRDQALVKELLETHQIDAVVHFAGLKSVADSVQNPLGYYDNNVLGSLALLRAMQETQVRTLVFSSSATVYGVPQYLPYDEQHPVNPINPYGHTKLQVEQILSDLAHSDPAWRLTSLRYFNPVGAHDSGLIGEDPLGIPNNLMPYVAQVAIGRRPQLQVFGNDYDTKDGTGERDYIHVMDLAEGHLAALNYSAKHTGYAVFNLGTGQSHSVLELIHAFEKVSGQHIAREYAPRRAGDLPAYFADAKKAEMDLKWQPTRNLEQMCASVWTYYQSKKSTQFKANESSLKP